MRLATSILIAIATCSQAFAQVELTGEILLKVNSTGSVVPIGESLYLKSESQLTTSKVAVFKVESQANLIEVSVTDVNRVPYPPKVIADKVYEIDKPGKWWIEVNVNDFDKRIWGRKTIVLDFDGGAHQPNPPPPVPPSPPTPVPNTYGVGLAAYQHSPRDGGTASRYAAIYKQASDFLYGQPTLKFIYSSNDVHNSDPNRSIFAWIEQEKLRIACKDRETCEAWKACREKLKAAFNESQTKRQYTRQDWYNALNEAAKGFEAVK